MKRERSTGGIQCPITAYIAGHVSPYFHKKRQINFHGLYLLFSNSLHKSSDELYGREIKKISRCQTLI